MKKHNNTSALLSGFLSGTLRSKEKAVFYQYVMDDSHKDEIMSCLQEEWTWQTADISNDTMFAKIKAEIEKRSHITAQQLAKPVIRIKSQKWKIFFRYAAILIIAFGLSWIIKISISNISNIGIATVTSPEYNEILAPIGSKTKLILPDSTIVWLNAGSKIEYPADFAAQRVVNLEGEAYFHVTHHTSVPFTVHAFGVNVTVMGTIFNINAYQNEAEVITTLVEGKIALKFDDDQSKQTFLTPNQQLVFNKYSKEITLADVDSELFISWVNGYFRFENISFDQIARHFEHAYGITIRFEDESLKTNRFTGTFLQNGNIESVLELLREIKSFNYTIQGNQITISQ